MKTTTKTRALSLLMALCLMVTVLPLSSQANSGTSDASDDFDYPRIPDLLMHSPYIQGYEDGTFRPDTPVTRAEAAVVLWHQLQHYEQQPSYPHSYFSDVPDGLWYSDAVYRTAELYLLTGYEDSTFRPYEPITREQLAVVICRFFQFSSQFLNNPFSDITGSWAYEYIVSAAEHGLMRGYEDGTFRPMNAVTRAEIITVINRAIGRQMQTENIPEEYYTFYSDLPVSHWAFQDILEASVFHQVATFAEDGTERWGWHQNNAIT